MDEDGGATLFLGLVALAVAGLRALRPEGRQRWMWGALVAFVLATLIGANNWSDVDNIADQIGTRGVVEIGRGLVLVTLTGVGGAVLSFLDARGMMRSSTTLPAWVARASAPSVAAPAGGTGLAQSAPEAAAPGAQAAGACEACGAPFRPGARFCGSCGATVAGA